jgi:hypothetical protein
MARSEKKETTSKSFAKNFYIQFVVCCQRYRMINDFCISYLVFSQIWLNLATDGCHFCWALPPTGTRDYGIGSNFWKSYLIRTGFTLGEAVSLVKVFRLFATPTIIKTNFYFV